MTLHFNKLTFVIVFNWLRNGNIVCFIQSELQDKNSNRSEIASCYDEHQERGPFDEDRASPIDVAIVQVWMTHPIFLSTMIF